MQFTTSSIFSNLHFAKQAYKWSKPIHIKFELLGNQKMLTSNVTGHHQGRKRKLRAGYRVPSLQPTSYFLSSSMVSCCFSALCVYSKFRDHPHPLGYLCANLVSFVASTADLAHVEKLRTHSITKKINHPDYLMRQELKLLLRKHQTFTEIQALIGFPHTNKVQEADTKLQIICISAISGSIETAKIPKIPNRFPTLIRIATRP